MTATENYRDQLAALAKAARAKRILEVGGGPEGVSGRAFTTAMGAGGELWTIDIDEKHPPLAIMNVAQSETGCAWCKINGDSTSVDIGPIAISTPFDLLYIDGAHDAAHAFGDFSRFLPLLRPGALVVFDDYPIAGGVHAAVSSLAADGWAGVRMIYDHHNGNSHYVMQVPNGGAR